MGMNMAVSTLPVAVSVPAMFMAVSMSPVAVAVPAMFMAVSMFPVAVLILQMDVKIKGVNPAFLLPSKMQMIPAHSQAFKGLFQNLSVRPQIQ